MINIILILFSFLILAGTVVLQVFLSRKQSRWPGLILPGLSFVLSVVIVLSIVMYTNTGVTKYEEITEENGVIVAQKESLEEQITDNTPFVFSSALLFLLSNVPTVIHLGIYFACREKLKRNRQIEKMHIQDLE